ncbi:hypothetical protein [Tamlana flava]|uniref:hypothetical protein n=1 Tax=Tamlana flava TaxID=3158572 RepID=UPI00351AC08E
MSSSQINGLLGKADKVFFYEDLTEGYMEYYIEQNRILKISFENGKVIDVKLFT